MKLFQSLKVIKEYKKGELNKVTIYLMPYATPKFINVTVTIPKDDRH